jgi:hypothetical protein
MIRCVKDGDEEDRGGGDGEDKEGDNWASMK